jgi:hypothetical protein
MPAQIRNSAINQNKSLLVLHLVIINEKIVAEHHHKTVNPVEEGRPRIVD